MAAYLGEEFEDVDVFDMVEDIVDEALTAAVACTPRRRLRDQIAQAQECLADCSISDAAAPAGDDGVVARWGQRISGARRRPSSTRVEWHCRRVSDDHVPPRGRPAAV